MKLKSLAFLIMLPSFATLADSPVPFFYPEMKGNLSEETKMIVNQYQPFEKQKSQIVIEHRKNLYKHQQNLYRHQKALYDHGKKLHEHGKQLHNQASKIEEIKVEQKTNINTLNKKNAEHTGNIANNSKSIANNSKSIANNSKSIANNASLIEHNYGSIKDNSNDLSMLSTKLDNQTSVAQGLQNQFNNFKDDYESYKTRTNSAIAGVTALSMLPQPIEVGKGNFAIGVGHYHGETAAAIGFGYSVNETVTLRTGASYSKEMKRPAVGAAVAWNF